MREKSARASRGSGQTGPAASIWLLLAGYLCCIMLMISFVFFFPLFRQVEQLFGKQFILLSPLFLPLVTLFCLLWQRLRRPAVVLRYSWVAAGCFCCLCGLLVPDADFAVKRIHVSQYLFLSLAVRWAMVHRLNGRALWIYSAIFTSLLGVHDELLQGLHPLRTYGLRDMLVNALAALGGALLGHGLGLFDTIKNLSREEAWPGREWLYLIWLVVAVLLAVVPLPAYRLLTLPLWPFVPLATLPVLLAALQADAAGPRRHGLQMVSLLAVSLLMYGAHDATMVSFY